MAIFLSKRLTQLQLFSLTIRFSRKSPALFSGLQLTEMPWNRFGQDPAEM